MANITSLAYFLQRTKQFLKNKTVRFFAAPNDESLSIARRALKLGATILTTKEKPDYGIYGSIQLLEAITICNSSRIGDRAERFRSKLTKRIEQAQIIKPSHNQRSSCKNKISKHSKELISSKTLKNIQVLNRLSYHRKNMWILIKR